MVSGQRHAPAAILPPPPGQPPGSQRIGGWVGPRPGLFFVVVLILPHTCFSQLFWQCPLVLIDLLLETPIFF
jgi:hypothetical protein